MKLVVGLGNPGAKYDGTRHNAGFAALDLVATRHGVTWESAPRGIEALIGRWRRSAALTAGAEDTVFAKPLTFMNLSGAAIVPLLHFYKIEVPDLLVIVDDVNLDAGRLRIRSGGSAGGHNGLKSIIASLGTDEFSRLRIGVGGGAGQDLSPHVLGRFSAEEEAVIEAAIAKAVEAVEVFVADGVVAAMNKYNRKDDKTAEDN